MPAMASELRSLYGRRPRLGTACAITSRGRVSLGCGFEKYVGMKHQKPLVFIGYPAPDGEMVECRERTRTTQTDL